MKRLLSASGIRYDLVRAYDHTVDPRYLKQQQFADLVHVTWFLRRGSVRIASDRRRVTVEAGNWVFFDPFQTRGFRFEKGTHIISIGLQVEAMGLHFLPPLRPLSVVEDPQLPGLLDQSEHLMEQIRKWEADPADLVEECRFQAAFYAWLAIWHAARNASPVSPLAESRNPDPRIIQLLGLLSERMGLGVLDYPELEQAVGLSRSQIDRLFKQELNLTPRQWCEHRTVAMAEEYLQDSRYSIKEIAHLLQFTDSSHFAKWFRRRTGMTPGDVRTGAS